MAKCGNCKAPSATVTHIRQCYQSRYAGRTAQRYSFSQGESYPASATSVATIDRPSQPVAQPGAAWGIVNELRKQVTQYLAPKPSGDRVGYFAINVVDGLGGAPVKFYRVKAKGGRVYVDAQASDEYHALRSPGSLKMVLSAILADPKRAAGRYADELGRCYRCGRTLTDDTSRSVGMGPECRSKS